MIFPEPRTNTESFRKELFPANALLTSTSAAEGLPIRTSVPAHVDLPERAPRTPEAQERLRKRANTLPGFIRKIISGNVSWHLYSLAFILIVFILIAFVLT